MAEASTLRTEFQRRMQARTPNEESVLAVLVGLAGAALALVVTAILVALQFGEVLGPVLGIFGIILCVIGGVGGFTITRIWLRAGRAQSTGNVEWPVPI